MCGYETKAEYDARMKIEHARMKLEHARRMKEIAAAKRLKREYGV